MGRRTDGQIDRQTDEQTGVNLNALTITVAVKMEERRFDGWLVGCFGLNGPLTQYFSLYRAVFQREGERKEK